MSGSAPKNEVRHFYDEIGWKLESDGFYQNARYEDLRPVSADYIHRCHLRLVPYFQDGGKYFLDAGSGPIQYREYLAYSEKFEFRVCLDISITALKEARKRIGDHGLFVVGDVANLPFSSEVFAGAVSLHTLHHLPLEDQKKAWSEINRVLLPGRKAVVVNGWTESAMMKHWQKRVLRAEKIGHRIARIRGKENGKARQEKSEKAMETPTGTYIQKLDANWIRSELPAVIGRSKIEIRCWRSVNVRWLRALIHNPYGKAALRHLFALEEKKPEYYGEYGQYPMIILTKEN